MAGPAGLAFLAQRKPDGGGQIVATKTSGCLLPVPEAALLRVLSGCERRGEGWQVAEGSGSADMVRVVAGFDDHAVADPGDEDVRDQDGPTAGRSLVAELGDDNLRIPGSVHVQ